MEIPRGLTKNGLVQAVSERIQKTCQKEKERVVCRGCKRPIQTIWLVALECFGRHTQDHACTGNGKSQRLIVPYCLNCDGMPPETETCVHTLAPRQQDKAHLRLFTLR